MLRCRRKITFCSVVHDVVAASVSASTEETVHLSGLLCDLLRIILVNISVFSTIGYFLNR